MERQQVCQFNQLLVSPTTSCSGTGVILFCMGHGQQQKNRVHMSSSKCFMQLRADFPPST